MVIFFNFSPTSNHLRPLQVENRLVADVDDNGKFRPERVNYIIPRDTTLTLLTVQALGNLTF